MRHEIAHCHDADKGQRGQSGALLPHAVHQPAGDDAHKRRAQNEGARGKTTDGIGCPEALDGVQGHGRYREVKDKKLAKISHPRQKERGCNQWRLSCR